jgi:hypothetical protein
MESHLGGNFDVPRQKIILKQSISVTAEKNFNTRKDIRSHLEIVDGSAPNLSDTCNLQYFRAKNLGSGFDKFDVLIRS